MRMILNKVMKSRQTEQKKAILDLMVGEGKHFTAEQARRVLLQKGYSISLATVYRRLNQLVEDGFIRRLVGEKVNVFDGNPLPHDHFVCLRCGKLIDFGCLAYDFCPDRRLEKQVPKLKIISHTTLFEGYCEECQKEEDKTHGIQGIKDGKKFT